MDQQQEEQKNENKSMTLNDFTIMGTLGRGAYGEVVLAKRNSDGLQVAIKMLDKKFLQKEKKQYQVFIEKEVLSRLDHPGIIKLYGSFQSADKIYFVMELIEGGDFAHFLKINKKFSTKTIQFYVAQIIEQLECLHTYGIAHRDVKPENILLTKEGHLKMIDFGTCSFFDESKMPPEILQKIYDMKKVSKQDERFQDEDEDSVLDNYQSKHKATFVGTAEYVSPELLEDDQCGPEADLWALGCIIYKMYTGKTPFNDATEYLVFQKVKSCRIDIPENLPPEVITLISKLLIREPSIRLGAGTNTKTNTFKELKDHVFFRKINWNNLWEQEPPKDIQLKDSREANYESDDENERSQMKSSVHKSEISFQGVLDKKVGKLNYLYQKSRIFNLQAKIICSLQ